MVRSAGWGAGGGLGPGLGIFCSLPLNFFPPASHSGASRPFWIGSRALWTLSRTLPAPWHVAATVVPDPGGIAAIRRWLSASDTTGTKAKVLPTPEGPQAQQAEWSRMGLRPLPGSGQVMPVFRRCRWRSTTGYPLSSLQLECRKSVHPFSRQVRVSEAA